ncbi:leukocyte elastase inhibitor-like [Protopterus annectens]|uniref:leukocyte elastase inhibitor-like n=1 Tax=Protopterus annectens TaxID=7888 RepID=UPI001CFC26CD|nr:leukocyte elastase inhibitor-like [Protopterus annectens]
MKPLITANTKFALDLFKHVTGDSNDDNIFFSPLSLSVALAMVYFGARGNTAEQLAKILHYAKTSDVHRQFKALNAVINNPSSLYEIKIANRLFGEKTFDFVQKFLDNTKKFYQAELSRVDFLHQSETARRDINAWVESQTEGKIKDLLPEGSVESDTVLILANAIYFKGTWKKTFEPWNTEEHPFRISKNDTVKVQMMKLEEDFRYNYISELHLSILELPYLKDETSMLILLPDDFTDESTGLDQLQKELSFEKLSQWTDPINMQETCVYVYLPKFNLEKSYDMKCLLTKMGITDIFCRTSADLSGMTTKDNLFVSKVAHKSFVDVNEQGTLAAAATGIVCTADCLRLPGARKVFKADHPFLFFIRHNESGSILFFGRFCQP